MNVIAHMKERVTLDKVLFCAWAVAVIGSNLQTMIHPHLDWALALLFVVLSGRSLLKQRFELPWTIAGGAVLLVASVCITALVSARPLYDLKQAAKLAAILIAGLAFFVSRPEMAKTALRTQVYLTFVNAVLIAFERRLPDALASIATNDGRWGTLFNSPGTLGGVGLGVLVYGLYLLFRTRRDIHGALLVSCALALVYLENSRTTTLLAILGVGFFIASWMWERWGSMRRAIVISLLALVGLSIVVFALDLPIPHRFERMVRLVMEEGLAAGLAESDPVRADMMRTAMEAVSRFPLLGSGMGTLGVETKVGWIQVHMAYLQMWADAGLLAFVGFVWLALGWVIWMPAAMQRLQKEKGSENNALTYNAIFMLIALALANLFHTYSTEWAQWLPYLTSVSFLYNTASKSRGVVRDEFQRRDRDVQPTQAPSSRD